MSLKVAYRNWAVDGVPHVHEFDADAFNISPDRALNVRSGQHVVAVVAAGEWVAIWDPAGLTTATAAAAAKAAPKAAAAPAAANDPAPAAPPANATT